MPIYEFKCPHCDDDSFERTVPIEARNQQCCRNCGTKLVRKIAVFRGTVWAPTAGGMR